MSDQIVPLVSVVITTYKRAALLPRSMMSIINQRYPRVELVVVNGHSPDNTADVVRNFINEHPTATIRYIEEEENLGISSSRNTGAKSASGEYIAFLDDDDEFLPDYISEVMKAFSKLDKDYGAVCTGMILIDAWGWQSYAPSIYNWHCAPGSGWTFRREVFSEGGLWYDTTLHGQEDLEFGLRFFQRYKGFDVDKPLRKYYFTLPDFPKRTVVATSTADREKTYRCYSKIFEMHHDLFFSVGDTELSGEYLRWGLIAGQAGKMDAARKHLRDSLRLHFGWQAFFYWLASLTGAYGFMVFDILKSRVMRVWKVFFSRKNILALRQVQY